MASSEKASTSTRIQCRSQYCAAVNCRNSRDKEPGLSFHYFPKCGKKDKDKTLERLVDENGVDDNRVPYLDSFPYNYKRDTQAYGTVPRHTSGISCLGKPVYRYAYERVFITPPYVNHDINE